MAALHYDLVDLRLFANIAEAGNITRGAARSALSLGAASLRIKNLEESFGTKLLVRHSGGVELTGAGSVLLDYALKIGGELESLHGELQVFAKGLKGKIRVFANTTAITEFLPSVLGEYLASHPNVDIDLEERLSPEIARAVAEGVVDFGILAGGREIDDVEMIPYLKDRLVLATAPTHALAHERRISFSQALGHNFVSLHAGSAIHGFLQQVAADLATTLNIRIRVSSFEALCRMVETGVGIGLLPNSVAARMKATHNLAVVELSDPWAERDLKICVRKRDDLPIFTKELIDLFVAASSRRSDPPQVRQDA